MYEHKTELIGADALVAWARPALKAEIKRIAELNNLSVSATMVSLLEKAVQQSLHEQHAALLQPLVEQAVRREMRSLGVTGQVVPAA